MNLLRNPPKITNKPIQKNFNGLLDIKLRQFTEAEHGAVLKKLKKKSCRPWKNTSWLKDKKIWWYTWLIMQDTIEKWMEDRIIPFFKKGNLRITKNFRDITLSAIDAEVYNVLLLSCIQPEIEKILKKNQYGFWKNWSTTYRLWQSIRSSQE